MSMQKKTELSNECNSGSSEIVLKNKQQNPVDFLMVTRMPQKSYKFQWIIRQFSTIAKNKALHSSDIRTITNSCYQLKLVKYEHGFDLFHVRKTAVQSNQISAEKTSIFMNSQSAGFGSGFCFGQSTASLNEISEETEIKNVNEFTNMLNYQVSATDTRGGELIKWSVGFSDDHELQSYKIGEYKSNTLKHFTDDSLILDCKLQVHLVPTTEEIPISFKPSLECKAWKKLSEDFKALYQNPLGTDITLVVGTEKISAHKLILTARSGVFQKIFQHDMKESEQNSVIITDVEFSALQRLITFLYTGAIADGESKGLALQELFYLYYAADKYEVMDLREMVGNTLLGSIQVNNACEMLIWADRHNDKYLKSRIINYIRLNFPVVSNEDAWKSFTLQHPILAVEVFSVCVKKFNIHE